MDAADAAVPAANGCADAVLPVGADDAHADVDAVANAR